jgi:actin-related protein 8
MHSDYLKRDDQLLAFRLQNEEARNRMTKTAKDRDRALALGKPAEVDGDTEMDGDTVMEDVNEETPAEAAGSKVIVIHVGSQNLRIGLASDALPKTVPMVIARKSKMNESEEEGVEPRPKRVKLDEDDDDGLEPEKQFGPEVCLRE